MDPVLDELSRAGGRAGLPAPAMAWVGGLTGELISDCEPGYWVRQAREAVRFADAVAVMAARGIGCSSRWARTGPCRRWAPRPCPMAMTSRAGSSRCSCRCSDRGRAPCGHWWRRWPRFIRAGWRWTGRRCCRAAAGGAADLRVPAPAVLAGGTAGAAAGGDGASSEAEAGFWAAVEGGDVRALSDALAVGGEQPLAEVLPALAAWRRRERDRSVTAGWRYRVRGSRWLTDRLGCWPAGGCWWPRTARIRS